VSLSCLPGALHCTGNSMGGDLRTWWREALNEVQAALWKLILGRMHHRGTCRVLAPRTHSILQSAFSESIELCVRHRSVNYAAGAIGMRCNFISMILCAILHYCQTTRSWDDVYHPPFSICDLHRQIYWSTLCAWYVQHSQQFLTLIQYMCNKKVDVPKSWLHWANVLYPAPCHPLQPRIAEFWSVHEPLNLEIYLNWLALRTSVDLLTENCGKQTPSDRKLFFRANLLYVPNIKM